MSCHPDRVRLHYAAATAAPTPVSTSSCVDTTVIKSVERDVRTILDFMSEQYTNDDLRQAMKRLRHWVGY